ncbi:hypothetical protein CBM2631_A210012 [Cupriavidus taiwanensis]|nr:hypothetical protein CBM2591_A230012 [Cupriavidus taiwanensis]SOZ86311.1 hypothetical protein CBM2621_A170019 [Cupriavidus taiwanensis]SPA13835.1 hypothetical protein CBM2631_A210012 [Cupriavidus taiwanensis]
MTLANDGGDMERPGKGDVLV